MKINLNNDLTSKMYSKVRQILNHHNAPNTHTALVADLVYGILDLVPEGQTTLCEDHSWAGTGECPKCETAFKGLVPEAPRGMSEEEINELRRVTACFADPWPDIPGEHVVIGRVKWCARELTKLVGIYRKLEALKSTICSAWIMGVPNFREQYDDKLLELFDVKSYDELYKSSGRNGLGVQPGQISLLRLQRFADENRLEFGQLKAAMEYAKEPTK